MSKTGKVQAKNSSTASSAQERTWAKLETRPFTDEKASAAGQAFAPAASPAPTSPPPPPNLQAQREKIARAGFNFLNIPLHPPEQASASSAQLKGIQPQEVEKEKKDEDQAINPLADTLQPQETQQEEQKEETEPAVQLKCSECQEEEQQKKSESVQTKLSVGKPGDKYEQEADQMAAKVMAMPDTAIGQPTEGQTEEKQEKVQMKPLANSITPFVQRSSVEQNEDVQMKSGQQEAATTGGDRASSLESSLANQKGGGSPLPDDVRSFMEPKFGADFNQVRVHTDSSAVQMNKELGAQAFTHGSEIYYGAGKSPGKDELTAHELTHTLQQTGGVQAKTETPSEAKKQAKSSPASTPDAITDTPPTEAESAKAERLGNGQPQPAVTAGGGQINPEATKVESTNANHPSDKPQAGAKIPNKEREAKENATKSGKPESAQLVEIAPQQGKSAAVPENGSPEKAKGETSPVAKAVDATNPQEKIQLPTEATAPPEGEKTKGEQSEEGAKPGGKSESKALETVPEAQALKKAKAGNENANQNPKGNGEAASPETEKEKEKATTDATQATKGLDKIKDEAAQLTSAEINFAPPEQAEAGGGEKGQVVALKGEQQSGDRASLEQQRQQASAAANNFLVEAGGRVQTITGLGQSIGTRILGKAKNAKAAVMARVEQQKAAATAQIAQLRAQAQSETRAAIAQIQARHQAAAAAIPQTTAKAHQQVETEHNTALQALDERVNNQIQHIGELYNQAGKKYRDAGPKVGDEAVARAEERAKDYESKITGKDDNFWDGPLTDNRNKARANAAREVGKQYKQGLIDEANKQADKVQEGKPKDIESVHQIAKQSRETLKAHHKASLDSLKTAQKQALSQLKEAQTSVTEAANNSFQATLQSLDQQQAMQLQLLAGYGQRQVSAIERDAQKAIASLQDGVNQAAASLQSTIKDCQSQLQGMPAPNLEELSAALAEILGQVDSSVAKVQKQTEQGVTASEQGIVQGGQQAVVAVTGIAQSGRQESAAVVEGAKTTLSNLNQGATDGFKQIQEAFTTIVKDTTNTAVKGFGEITKGIDTTFEQVNQNLESGIEKSVADLEQGLRGALDNMDADIHKYAEEAAAKEEPRGVSFFKTFAKILLVVAVIAVAIVFAPAAIAAVGAVAGALGASAALAGGIGAVVGGAIVGAAAGAVIQMGNNVIDGKPLFQDIGKAVLAGAIGGALGGAGGVLGNVLAQAGKLGTGLTQLALRTGIDVAFDMAGGIFGNLATGEPITLEGILIGAGIAAGVNLATAKQSLGKLGKFGSSVEGMQTKSFQAGERFGTSIGDKVKSGFGGRVDAPTLSRPDVNRPGVKPPDTEVKAPDTGVKPPQTEVKAPETEVKAPETQVKPPETEIKAPETQVKSPQTDTPNGRSTHKDKPEVEPGVVAKETAADGHEIKVLKDGRIVRCSDCAEIRRQYKDILDSNDELRQRLDTIEKEPNEANKAQQAKQLEAELQAIQGGKGKLDSDANADPSKRSADAAEGGEPQSKRPRRETAKQAEQQFKQQLADEEAVDLGERSTKKTNLNQGTSQSRTPSNKPTQQNNISDNELRSQLQSLRETLGVTKSDPSGKTVGGVIGVAKTDIPGLENELFKGASPEVRNQSVPEARQNAGLNDQPALGSIKSPGKIASAQNHAEQDLANQIANAIESKITSRNLTNEDLVGKTVFMHIDQRVCSTCKQGLSNPKVDPGVLKQLSDKYPNLKIVVTAEGTDEKLIIKGGTRLNK